jgi:hypothetical protein
VTARARDEIVTVAEFVAVTGGTALSVAVTMIETVPFAAYIVVKLAPVPVDGVPPVAVQLNVTVPVPPLEVAVQVTGLPTVPVAGQLIVTDRAPGLIAMVADIVAVFALESVIVTETVNVPGDAYIVVRLAPVPVAGDPPVAAHAKVYGPVPPVPVAVNVTGAFTPAVVGPAIVTASASGLTTIVAVAVAVFALASVIVTDTVMVPFVL